jgi:hypothetical protein
VLHDGKTHSFWEGFYRLQSHCCRFANKHGRPYIKMGKLGLKYSIYTHISIYIYVFDIYEYTIGVEERY